MVFLVILVLEMFFLVESICRPRVFKVVAITVHYCHMGFLVILVLTFFF
jgi:hypothetical protein